MTVLEVRRVSFTFDDDVPFCWHPENPEFALMSNSIGILIVGFEKYVVDSVRAAMPRITDPAVAEEADAFLRQEAQHSRAHRMHLKVLCRRYPGLKEVIDQVVRAYDRHFQHRPLEHHLAYIADTEAAFTPMFKQWLDHADDLFRPGDERVASLFLWHYSEEIEHRSSALMIYRDVVGRPWYRLGQLPSVARHVTAMNRMVAEGINRAVPLADRKVDARMTMPSWQLRRALAGPLPFLARGIDRSVPAATACIPVREQLLANLRILGAQTPNHDPEHQPLPELAGRWIARYDRGEDVSRWYSSSSSG